MRLLRLKVTGLLLLVVLSLGVVAAVSAQDVPALTFAILQDGDTISGTFEANKTAQLYAFNGSAGDVVTISMVQEEASLLDPYLILLGERGQVFASDDDSGEDPLFSAVISDFELPVDGSYYIMATSFLTSSGILADQEWDEPQNYEISISGITPPENLEGFDPETVLLFSTDVEPGTEGTAETLFEEPVYYFKFLGNAGDTVSITADTDNFDPIIHLFDPTGVRIAVNDDADGLNAALTDFKLPEDGEYLFFVTASAFYDAVEDGQSISEEFTGFGEFDLTFN